MILIVAVTLIVSLLALAALVFLDGPAELAAYEILLLVTTLTLVSRLGTYPSGKSLWLWKRKVRAGPALPPRIVALQRSVESANNWAREANRKLLPHLRSLAEERLREFHSIDIASHPWGARRLLGENTWQLLWPDQPESGNRSSRGVDMSTIDGAVTAIERLAPSQPIQSDAPSDTLGISE